MMKKISLGLATGLVCIAMAGTAGANLLTIGTATYSADPAASINTPVTPGGHDFNLIYDTDLQLTWLDYTASSRLWSDQKAWAAGLNGAGVLEYSLNADIVAASWDDNGDWRLPAGSDVVGQNYDTAGVSEMGHLYYTELGNAATGPLVNSGAFANLTPAWYWSGTEMNFGSAWVFIFNIGMQGYGGKDSVLTHGLAVRPGQVAVVPEPASTVLLLTGGVMGVLLAGRRRLKGRRNLAL